MIETIPTDLVPVNFGKLLENQLKKWEGGGQHPRGIAEYITNSDDSYRRWIGERIMFPQQYYPLEGKIEIFERPLRCQTMQGPRVSIAASPGDRVQLCT